LFFPFLSILKKDKITGKWVESYMQVTQDNKKDEQAVRHSQEDKEIPYISFEEFLLILLQF
jgi:hypothetical protein